MSEEPGPSTNKPYWELQAEMESREDPEFVPRDDEMEEDEDTSSDDEEMEDAEDGEDRTTTDGGGEATTDGGSASKKARKERTPIMVDVSKRSIITSVSDKGAPLAPENFVVGYSNQLAAILRSTVTINTENLKSIENRGFLIQLFRKLHARYAFPGDDENKYNNDNLTGNPVNKYALKKMNKALSNWKARVKKLIFTDKLSYSEVFKKKEPLVKEEDYNVFKARQNSVLAKAKSKKGQELRALNIGTHHLGSGGYRAAKPKWEKEDAEYRAKGLPLPFDDIKEEQAKNFIRARFAKPKGSSDYSSEPTGPFSTKVKDFMDKYVSSLHASRLIAFTTNQ
jgi:hypothetical protein